MKKKDLNANVDLTTSEIHKDFLNIEFEIVLIETEGSANIGSICRSMKNFGFKSLVLFNPQCEIDSDTRKYAMHAREDVLNNAEIIKLDPDIKRGDYLAELKTFFDRYDFVIATSGKPSMFRNIKRTTYYVDEIDLNLIKTDHPTKIAVVFGREPHGLYNEELELVDFTIRVPTSDEYPSMNLAHAVTVVLFSLYKKIRKIKRGSVEPSNRGQREHFYRKLQQVIELVEFEHDIDDKVIRTFKNLLGRNFSSMKEVNLMITLFNQILIHDKLSNTCVNKERNNDFNEY